MNKTPRQLCDEFIEQEFEENSLDEIIAVVSERWKITEYPYSELMKNDDNAFPTPAHFYHYDFAEIAKEFNELNERCGECTPMIINHISIRGSKIHKQRRKTYYGTL
jgi:hypothetical protein